MEAPVSVRQTGGSLRPLDPDEMMCIWCSPQSGTYEWLVGRELADDLLNGGMETINGNPVRLEVVDTNPRARALYEREGYVAVRTERTPYLRRAMGFGEVTTMERRVP